MSAFQGDPTIKFTVDGSTLKFTDGQPVMDGGYENAALISLFTEEGWVGNVFADTEAEKIGSKFLEATRRTITITSLENIRKEAISALQWLIDQRQFKSVNAEVTNPTARNIMVLITIIPPNGEAVNLTLENFGATWKFQKEDPAHRRLQ